MCLAPLCMLLRLGCAVAIVMWLVAAFAGEDIHTSRRSMACSVVLAFGLCLTFSRFSILHLLWVLPLVEYVVGPLVYFVSTRDGDGDGAPTQC